MAKERLITGTAATPEEDRVNQSLRPSKIDDYVGQPKLIERLKITLAAVKQRSEPMEHVLLHGPPGLGKTTLAHIIANEMATHLIVTSGPAISKPADLVGTLTKLQHGDVLFIDEIHRLNIALEEYLYSAMEDFKIDFTLDSGLHAKVITMPIKPFCLIGATTRAGLISGPMRSRFGLLHNLEYYSEADLIRILRRSAGILGIGPAVGGDAEKEKGMVESLAAIAERARGTPRIANRLLRRVRDFAQVRNNGQLSTKVIQEALTLEGVDQHGLDELDRKYMRVIGEVYRGGPVGLEAIAATLGEDSGTLEDTVEPYLLQIGFLARTRRGRQLTIAGGEHVGLKVPEPELGDDGLFAG
jgi:holliday junction DNA helicase RuvB